MSLEPSSRASAHKMLLVSCHLALNGSFSLHTHAVAGIMNNLPRLNDGGSVGFRADFNNFSRDQHKKS